MLAFGALSGCQSAAPNATPATTTPLTLTATHIAALKRGVISRLKDPESARFDEAFVASEDKDTIYVCGYVNAKNSYGGYVGARPFYAAAIKMPGVPVIFSAHLGDGEFGPAVVRGECAKVGIPI